MFTRWNKFVSAGFTILAQFDTSKVENGHKIAIVSCPFVDDEKLVTFN